jgi:hypothetical protein
VLGFYLERHLGSEGSGAVMSAAAIRWAIFSLILRHIVGRPKATAISSSAHADQICGCQTYCFLLTRLHDLPMASLKETKRQHAFAPLFRITLAMVSRRYVGAKHHLY